jgi:hypothetical protein
LQDPATARDPADLESAADGRFVIAKRGRKALSPADIGAQPVGAGPVGFEWGVG